MTPDLAARAFAAFAEDAAASPPLTLRGGADIDGYDNASPYDATLDQLTDDYLTRFAYWSLPHLDASSWRHYLPYLIDYALRHAGEPGDMVVEGLLSSLRPPDREPPRLASLSPEQEAVVTELLERLAFGPGSAHAAFATQVLGEYWVPNALYRK